MSWNTPRQQGLAAAIWAFIEERQGVPFTCHDVAKALPELTRSGIRSYLFWLVRKGKVAATPAHAGHVYRQRIEGEADPFNAVLLGWGKRQGKTEPDEEPQAAAA